MCSQAENQNVDSVEEKENIATEQQAETVVENNDEATKVEDAETLLKINKLTEDLAAAKDEVLRAQAEVANMRRRCEQEVDKARKFALDRFEKENAAAYFDGNGSYLEIPDNDVFSIVEKGALTISVWVSPEVLTFEKAESGGYVHWMGKGIPHQHEWVFRMYNKDLTAEQENRPNRMSAYAFNLEGGLGSGSYVQESLEVNEWIHFVARYDVKENSITLFKNGIEKDRDSLYDATYGVQVQNGEAPIRLGTRSGWSFFQGRIDDLRIYNRALTEEEILALYNEKESLVEEDSTTLFIVKNKKEKKGTVVERKLENFKIEVLKNDNRYDLKGRTISH
ncbi:MAG: LamG-like jellyroll fold domain-containing protein [Fibrobacteraceae bacterium]|nr:LamG-like jellyroll fold domain-containing protein [Fibrobacteraceae bacterium]